MITQHRARDGWVSRAAVIDACSRRIGGWSISDHITAEVVVDALEMARWQRRPVGTIVHGDRGAQWLCGRRLRQAGLLGSMGPVASSVDNALIESFWSTMQRELLDRTAWDSRTQFASAMLEWIEGFYNPTRRHSAQGNLAPPHSKPFTRPPSPRHDRHGERVRETGAGSLGSLGSTSDSLRCGLGFLVLHPGAPAPRRPCADPRQHSAPSISAAPTGATATNAPADGRGFSL